MILYSIILYKRVHCIDALIVLMILINDCTDDFANNNCLQLLYCLVSYRILLCCVPFLTN